MKEKLVAIKYDELGKCEKLLIVKNVQDQEFKALKNEENEHKELEFKKELELNKRLCNLEKNNHNNSFLIAKSIYDNFVDRGLLEDNAEFQQMFYDMIFNKGEFDIAKMPKEFETILNYVRGY